jgi:hypothetical protein
MREVYATVNIDVEWATEETRNIPALNVVDVGQCIQGQTTSEQNQLFINRNFASANDIVVYFVLATDPSFNGCAAHPLGTPVQWSLGLPRSGLSPTKSVMCSISSM